MPKPRPLSPTEAAHTLAHRLGPRVDRVRQIATKLGIRPYHVFLVWEKWSGEERGEGDENVIARLELLPTPKVESIDAISLRLYSAGVLPVGSIRVRRISTLYTQDQLTGLVIPTQAFLKKNNPPTLTSASSLPAHKDHVDEPYEFFWLIQEDGRGDNPPLQWKYRISSTPYRKAGGVHWEVILERISEDNDRMGRSQIGNDRDP